MQRISSIFLVLVSVVPLTSTVYAAEQLVPAGSIVQCVTAEPNLSSETETVGDPILCEMSYVELYGRSEFPYGSYLLGHFEAYKDPGHFVGKGWMELKFDRMLVQPDTMVPISAKVIGVPDYTVDKEGRIRGRGHAVRDVVEWSLPILWPIDLLNLPRRGPRPVLKAETTLTLKIMQDVGIPTQDAPIERQTQTQRSPLSNSPGPETPAMAPSPMLYRPARPPTPMPVYALAPAPLTLLIMRNGYGMYATSYSLDSNGLIHYTALNGSPVVMPLGQLDMNKTVDVNQRRGVYFSLQQPATSTQQPSTDQPPAGRSPHVYTVASRY